MPRTRQLDPVEIRVLGALLEKQQTTPDAYPLSTHALIAACNQKSNRDPVTELTETQVVEALDRLREDVLVWRSESARSERWAQRLDRRWELDPRAKAVMTLLLLRGAQTPGELRSRSDRLHPFESVAEVEETLERLSTGIDALVRQLPRQPGQREARWMHLAAGEEGLEAALGEAPPPAQATADTASAPARPAAVPRAAAPAAAERLDRLEAAVRRLESTVAALEFQLGGLRADLGVE